LRVDVDSAVAEWILLGGELLGAAAWLTLDPRRAAPHPPIDFLLKPRYPTSRKHATARKITRTFESTQCRSRSTQPFTNLPFGQELRLDAGIVGALGHPLNLPGTTIGRRYARKNA
jgi:hypothetical protein